MKKILENLLKLNTKPPLFEGGFTYGLTSEQSTKPGELKFWDDPHISKCMLEAHLDPKHDAASRRPETIDKTIKHLLDSKVLKPGMKVLDLGCGPGLYAEKLYQAGIEVTGIDISERSLEYAKRKACEKGWLKDATNNTTKTNDETINNSVKVADEINDSKLKLEYKRINFFELDYENEFDAVIQVYGELCVFSDEMRDKLLKLIHRALKKRGVFIFDVTTRSLRMKLGLKRSWYSSDRGFWKPGKHLVLQEGYDFLEENVWLDQYIVIDEREINVFRNWFHDYSLESIGTVLENQGFKVKYTWNDLTGSTFIEGGDWIAIGAEAIK